MPTFLSRLLFDSRLRYARIKTMLLLYVAVIVVGSVPGARAEVGRYASGEVLHGMTYAALALLWFLGSTGNAAMRTTKAVLAIAVIGAVDELVQSFLPYRSAELRDWIVDITAALVTSTVLALIMSRQEGGPT